MTTKTKKPDRRRKPLSWKAKLRGRIYCAPACGANCTWAAYQRAEKAGAALARKLGKGWTYRTHENMGWFYRAISPCGRIEVSPFIYQGRVESYTAFHNHAGRSGGLWVGDGDNPQAAVDAALEEGRRRYEELTSLLEGLVDLTDPDPAPLRGLRVYIVEWTDVDVEDHRTIVTALNREDAWDRVMVGWRKEKWDGDSGGVTNIPLRLGFTDELDRS